MTWQENSKVVGVASRSDHPRVYASCVVDPHKKFKKDMTEIQIVRVTDVWGISIVILDFAKTYIDSISPVPSA